MVFVLFREVLINKFEKCSADVSLDVFTERRVVPDNISLSVASRSCRLLVFVVVSTMQLPFKQRFSQHKATFKHRKYTNSTELSKYIKTSTLNGL